ncbi:MAG: SHOCT domain-containing protein, partial [Microcoleus sp. SIO2G3]|nr:SHOCT domain-containing protein [Microcoleus sp. SIO2G3]
MPISMRYSLARPINLERSCLKLYFIGAQTDPSRESLFAAPLSKMNLSDELRKLQELYNSRALTAEEFAQAKQTVLSKHSTSNEASNQANLQNKLEEIELQNRLLQLDLYWQSDRENYMVR